MELRVELHHGGLEALATLATGTEDVAAAARRVLEELSRQGVTALPSAADVEAALSAAVAASPHGPVQAVVARGTPPRPGIDAQLIPHFPVRSPPPPGDGDPFATLAANVTYPDELVLRKTPASQGIPGLSLLGTPVPAPHGADRNVIAGDGVFREDDGLALRSKTYGVVRFNKGRVEVVEALRVSEDLMEARLTVVPDPRRDEDQQAEAILQALGRLGIRKGIDAEAVRAAVAEARRTGKPVADVPAARGEPPVDGREPDFRAVFDLERKAGAALAGDRIDFKETDSVKNARKGDVLAEVTPGQNPAPGFRLDGSVLNPQIHRAQGLRPGDHTELSADGTKVLAAADGMLVIKGGKFHIEDEYVVPGDVDFSTGNIRASGVVRVRGQVKPGFLVQAGKDVEIADDVWEGRIEAQGSVKVRGAITAGSSVKSGGSVSARYILNSRIEAEGDLDVALSVTGSEVYVRGRMRVLGSQGVVLGGEVNAAKGLEARTVGSAGSRTKVVVGVDLRVTREMEALQKSRSEIFDELKTLQVNLGREFLRDPKAALLALPPALRKTKLDVLQRMKDLQERERKEALRRDELLALADDERDAHLSVLGEIHAGTVVTVGPAHVTLAETLRHVVLHYDPEHNCVAWRKP